jgi:hypothetical protein
MTGAAKLRADSVDTRSAPNAPSFVLKARSFREQKQFGDALVTLLTGLSENTDQPDGRLELARIFFEMGCYPFAAREISLLHDLMPDIRSIAALNERLRCYLPDDVRERGTSASKPQTVVAEAEFDLSALDEVAAGKRPS